MADVTPAVLTQFDDHSFSRSIETPATGTGLAERRMFPSRSDPVAVADIMASRPISLDPEHRILTLPGTARVGDMLSTLDRFGLVVPAPPILDMTMADAVRCGGYGPLVGLFGLSVDNLVAATLHRPDIGKECVEEANDDLLWLLRGGNVALPVETLTFEMRALANVLAGTLVLPAACFGELLSVMGEICAVGSDALTITGGVVDDTFGAPVAFAIPVWAGYPDEAVEAIAPLNTLAARLPLRLWPHSFFAACRSIDRLTASGAVLHSFRVRSLNDDCRAAIAAIVSRRPSRDCGLVMHEFFGAATRVPRWSTGFPERRAHVRLDLHGSFSGDQQRKRLWITDAAERLAPHLLSTEITADEAARRDRILASLPRAS